MRPETRERIIRIAREMGFRPNPLAKGLATRVNFCVGAAIDARHLPIKRSFYGAVLEGVEEVMDEAGYQLVFSVIRHGDLPRSVLEGRVDGLILMGTDIPPQLVEDLKGRVPLVLVDHHLPGVDAVVSNNVGGARCAVEHLIAHGHRRIAFVVETLSDPNFRERLLGYREALEAHGISFDETLVFVGGRRRGSPRFAMGRLLEMENPPTAIFGANDHMAIGALQALREAGLEVPRDVALVGFDDGDLAPHAVPPLTSVRVSRKEMGRTAARRLLQLICSPSTSPKLITLPTELVIRASCGCPGT